MFESLTEKFNSVFRSLSGRGRITEANISDAMHDVRKALLEADVNYNVVKQFCKDVTQAAVGAEVIKSLHPGQVLVKIVNDELTRLMGPVDSRIYFVSPGPTIVMLAGLQGCGKTTTAAKLANYLVAKGKKTLLVAGDLQRPAAIEQLIVLGQQINVDVYSEQNTTNSVKVAQNAVKHAQSNGYDVVVLDTAGRLHIDQQLMTELADVAKAVSPHQIYLVCDAMTGQDAVNSAKEFNDRLELDGVILTKLDGDARGGAALSVKAVTGKPIKFIGVGEKLDKLEEFHPERMAGRILGMGDVVSLVEKAQEHFHAEEAEKMQKKLIKGSFGFDDFLKQMQAVKKMGGIKSLLAMMPGMSQLKDIDMDGDQLAQMEAIVYSMTPVERHEPDIIDLSRRRRIAAGAGVQIDDVAGLVKTFRRSRDMIKALSGGSFGGLKNLFSGGMNMGAISQMMAGGKKIKQRSERKKIIKRKGKIKRR
jgi:signal recognition particle subunit SRP54